MTPIEHFSTRVLKPRNRLEFWNYIAEQTFWGTRITSADPLFVADLARFGMGEVVLTRPRSPAALIERQARGDAPDEARMIVHVQHRGSSRAKMAGRTLEVAMGDMLLCDLQHGYQLELSPGNDMLTVEMPRRVMLERLGRDRADCLAGRIDGRSPAARMLHSFILSCWQHGESFQGVPGYSDEMAGLLCDMLASTVRAEGRLGAGGEGLQERLKSLVARHLSDPALGAARLAQMLGVSPRTVQKAFAAMGTVPSAYIATQRLERAADFLAVRPRASITDLAYEMGFNDSAYFTRCFVARFGVAPSQYGRRS